MMLLKHYKEWTDPSRIYEADVSVRAQGGDGKKEQTPRGKIGSTYVLPRTELWIRLHRRFAGGFMF